MRDGPPCTLSVYSSREHYQDRDQYQGVFCLFHNVYLVLCISNIMLEIHNINVKHETIDTFL